MALKTFNLDEEVYKEFSKHCKKEGISMSKRIENFIKNEVEIIKNKKDNKNLQKEKADLIRSRIENEFSVDNKEHTFKKYC